LHIFPVDKSEHMAKPGAKLFFHFVYKQDEKKIIEGFQDIGFHYLGNQNILFIALKKLIFAIFFDYNVTKVRPGMIY